MKHFAEKLMLMALCGSIAGWFTHAFTHAPHPQEATIYPLPIILIVLTLVIARFVRHRGDLEKSFMVVTLGSAAIPTFTTVVVVLTSFLQYSWLSFSAVSCLALLGGLVATLALTIAGGRSVRDRNWANLGVVVIGAYLVTVILPSFVILRVR